MIIFKVFSIDAMCLGNGGCSTVNASPYSEIYGIPVAAVGLDRLPGDYCLLDPGEVIHRFSKKMVRCWNLGWVWSVWYTPPTLPTLNSMLFMRFARFVWHRQLP